MEVLATKCIQAALFLIGQLLQHLFPDRYDNDLVCTLDQKFQQSRGHANLLAQQFMEHANTYIVHRHMVSSQPINTTASTWWDVR